MYMYIMYNTSVLIYIYIIMRQCQTFKSAFSNIQVQ